MVSRAKVQLGSIHRQSFFDGNPLAWTIRRLPMAGFVLRRPPFGEWHADRGARNACRPRCPYCVPTHVTVPRRTSIVPTRIRRSIQGVIGREKNSPSLSAGDKSREETRAKHSHLVLRAECHIR